jgi:transcriptional regulator with XRE-family HTH domain
MSQLELAHAAEVSPRHLSFVETGRSKPSRELLLTLAAHLDVPLRDRNALLVAAGYVPRYQETELAAPQMERVLTSLGRLLDAHDPFPGVVLDRHWNVVLANRAAGVFTAVLPSHVAGPPLNIFRASLHPDGLAAITLNFEEWARYLLTELRRLVAATADPGLVALEKEVSAYPNVAPMLAQRGWLVWEEDPLLIPCRLQMGNVELSLFTTLTTFGTPRDITLDELVVELFFPADDASEAILRAT